MKNFLAFLFSNNRKKGAQPDAMQAWIKCNSCGQQEVKTQPLRIGSCPKCGGSVCVEMGLRKPDWFEDKGK
ncbi:hypothetical protein [Achromobacter sp. NFACC18-2]|uniref:hypothetical protein n=1 Tax=Achromobacter sp. NFACC18-2 TaxID=1564112 RepID=UPI0008B94E41|nr:hypothetical protein [Achromobacter sp. NFACC18-2]SEK09516.1 hypothetical protein SAMN03159494_05182 [Achromobacter sp. NFACC18-2]